MARWGQARIFRSLSSSRLKASAIGLGAVALGGVLAACGSSNSGTGPVKAANGGYSFSVLESTPGFFDLPLRVAIADFAPKYHLHLNIVTVTGGGTLATEFEGGTGTVAMVGVDTPTRLEQQNAIPGGISIIGTNMTQMLYALVAKAGSNYHTLDQLRSQNIAITGAGAASQVVLQWALLKAHMKLTDVHMVPLGSPPTILAGVVGGKVAAGTIFSPALDEGLSNHSVQMVFDFRQYPYAQNVFVARTKELQANPTAYKLFMQAYDAAVQKLESDPSFALASAEKYWGQGTTMSTLKGELDFYMNKEWKQTQFTQSLYDASRNVLLNSSDGFSSQGFPAYADLTKDAPNVG